MKRGWKRLTCWIYRLRLAILQVDIDQARMAQYDIQARLNELRARDFSLTLRLDDLERELRS